MQKDYNIDVVRLMANYGIVIHHAMATRQYVPEGTLEALLWKGLTAGMVAMAMPALFFLSGYLLLQSFSFVSFKAKLWRRVKRLLVPFIIWNLTFLLFYLSMATLFPRLSSRVESFGLTSWSGIVEKTIGVMTEPMDPPLWFLRTLLLFTLLSPLVWYGLRVWKGILVYLILAGWWLLTISFEWGNLLSYTYPVYGFVCLTLGAHLALLKRSPFDILQSRGAQCIAGLIGCSGVGVYLFHEFTWGLSYSLWRDVGFILATPFLFALAMIIGKSIQQLRAFDFLKQSSFFLYAGHYLFCFMLLHLLAPCLNGVNFIGKQTLLAMLFCVGGSLVAWGVYAVGRKLLGKGLAPWDGTL